MNHFTNKAGYDAIRSHPTWSFAARKPRADHHPVGVYFTTYGPRTPNLSVKIFVPREKLEFLFAFADVADLRPLPGGRGRLGHIFYSPSDYDVESTRQQAHGRSAEVAEAGGLE